jgi:hypothetical protein
MYLSQRSSCVSKRSLNSSIVIIKFLSWSVLEVIFGFESVENFEKSEGDGNGRISGRGIGVIVDIDDVRIVRSEGFENVVVIVEIEGDGSQCFSP